MCDPWLEGVRRRTRVLRSRERFGLFASAGLVGTLVDSGVLITMVEVASLGFLPAKVVAWVVAAGTIFVVNERLTFAAYGSSDPRAVGRRLVRSYVVRFAGFLVTLSVYASLVHVVGLWYLAANLMGIGAGFAVNYTCETLFTWRVDRAER